MPSAIEFENISKQYRLGLISTRTLKHDFNRWWAMNVRGKEDPYLKIGETNDRTSKGNSEYVWALKNIDFKVEQGDVVGIIGKNGAGKSTLLKLLSKVTAPTTGEIRAHGRIGSLLEVGTGFHPEMTGRENIFMNGAILGMTKQEIRSKLDEIVDFSGCERYLDTPVKRYSSGMMVRLGFAVAAHLDPEILVVDEVLAVGDAEFQKKAIGKMQDVSKGEGRTVLFVSHNMGSIRALCNTGILLEQGTVKYTGTANEVVDYYMHKNFDAYIKKTVITDEHRGRWGNELTREIEFTEVSILNTNEHLATDEPLEIEMKLHKNVNVEHFTIGAHIIDQTDKAVATSISPLFNTPSNDDFTVRLKISRHNLIKGNYVLSFNVGLKDVTCGVKDYDVIHNVLSFQIEYMDLLTKKPYAVWDNSWGTHYISDVEYEFD